MHNVVDYNIKVVIVVDIVQLHLYIDQLFQLSETKG